MPPKMTLRTYLDHVSDYVTTLWVENELTHNLWNEVL